MGIKKPAKIEHLINWYYGNIAYRYENCDIDMYRKIKEIASKLKVSELTHKEFSVLMKENLNFEGIRKKPCDCAICKKFGIGDYLRY
ncbi:hypothetical protein J4233_03205 [Candidatus Pacearchaeota archaeon]|nr:hypothetical protein [Candidatus Pacearchaeota archaeon]